MKKLENPTTFFFKQAENPPDLYRNQIDEFVNKLLDKEKCLLCKVDYDTHIHIPRIMIHCGHTFCTPCLSKFYMNRRVRCPMCLKLVKQLDSLDRLPINHTIFAHIVEKETKIAEAEGVKHLIKDAAVFLYAEFQRVQKEAHMQENPQKIDPDSGLPFCVFHNDRVEHFYCEAHKTSGCRVCIQIGHSKPDCQILDLYVVPDPQAYLNSGKPKEEPSKLGNFQIGNPKIARQANVGRFLPNNFEDEQDEDLVDDSDEEGDDEEDDDDVKSV